MNSSPRVRLFIMMVLELFIWGAWLPPLYGYMNDLKFDAGQQALIGDAFAFSAIVGIFFSNQFADRNFAAEKFMAFSHLVSGLAVLGLYFVKSFWPFFLLMQLHCLLYVPTLSVANSIAFAHLKNAQKEFGVVRMGGTVGWIAAAWPLYYVLQNKTGEELASARDYIFIVAGIASLLLAAYSLTLPHTPPRKPVKEQDRFAWLEAVRQLRRPFVLVLFIVTLIDSTIHNGYFVVAYNFLAKTGFKPEHITPVMSIGQVAEMLTMGVLGWFLKRLGWKMTMLIGIFGHAARFAVFAFLPMHHDVIIAVQLLHGICYAFFFATVYIFVDAVFPTDIRSSAQGLFNILIFGVGLIAANSLFLELQKSLTHEGVTDYRTLFLVPTGMALLAMLILGLFFHPPKEVSTTADEATQPVGSGAATPSVQGA